jgi:hypothetical protein
MGIDLIPPPVLGRIAGGITGGVVGLITSLAAEGWQRRIYGPKLEFNCGSSGSYRSQTDMFDGNGQKVAEGIYVRLRVRNVKSRIAKSCRAYLTSVEREKPDHSWQAILGESIQLAWTGQDQKDRFAPLNIPMGVDQFIDVVAVANPLPGAPEMPHFPIPQLATHYLPYLNLLQQPNTYRLTVLVAGDGVMPTSHRLIVKWTGVWNQVHLSDGGPGEIG